MCLRTNIYIHKLIGKGPGDPHENLAVVNFRGGNTAVREGLSHSYERSMDR